jgi:hypothetical protein
MPGLSNLGVTPIEKIGVGLSVPAFIGLFFIKQPKKELHFHPSRKKTAS